MRMPLQLPRWLDRRERDAPPWLVASLEQVAYGTGVKANYSTGNILEGQVTNGSATK